MHQKYYGKCLKMMFKQLEEKTASKTIDQSILNVSSFFCIIKVKTPQFNNFFVFIKILDEMNLKHAKKYMANLVVMKYPNRFANF